MRSLIATLVALVLAAPTVASATEWEANVYKLSGDGTNDWKHYTGIWHDDSDGKLTGWMLMSMLVESKTNAQLAQVDVFWTWKEGRTRYFQQRTHTDYRLDVIPGNRIVVSRTRAEAVKGETKGPGVTAAMLISDAAKIGPPKGFVGISMDVYYDELDLELIKLRLDKKYSQRAQRAIEQATSNQPSAAANALKEALRAKGYIESK